MMTMALFELVATRLREKTYVGTAGGPSSFGEE